MSLGDRREGADDGSGGRVSENEKCESYRHPSVLEDHIWSCALCVYSGTALGVAGQFDAGMTAPVAEGTDEA